MNNLERIESVLRAAARRRRAQRVLEGLAEGALAGGLVLVLALAAYKLLPIPPQIVPAAGGLAATLILLGAVRRAWTAESPVQTARWLDERQQLKERLSTALEVSRSHSSSAAPVAAAAPGPVAQWQELVVTDAARHLEGLDLRRVVRFAPPRSARWAALALAVAAGLGFVPEYRTAAQLQRQQDAAVVRDVGTNLAGLVRRELAQRPPALPAVERSLEEVAALGEQLGRQKLTKAEALRDLASAAEKLARQTQELDQNPALRRLEQAARQPGTAAEPGANAAATPDSLRKQIEALQQSLGPAADKEKQLNQLARDLEKLRQQAAAAADPNKAAQNGGAPSNQQLAGALEQLTQQAAAAGADLAALQEAIAALEAQQIGEFVRDLDLASHDLEKMREAAREMQQLQQQLSRMGKDLAEQLQFGQAQAAAQTLEQMMDKLQSAGASPEQLKKMLEEIERAAKPGQDYGRVGELLKQAARKGQQGDKPGAAKDLADARDELRKLSEQMQDSESLKSALAAMERAQSALSSSQRWSQVKPAGACKSCNGGGCSRCNGTGRRWAHGGRTGAGVGTWAEEEFGWTHFNEHQAPVDNSGVQRPDLDPRGVSDRPADLNPNLIPDKVKGRMSPGGSMPAITLKGVSVKGASNVRYEEAATAAQEEAQNALNQDRVPRAYQNAVRDYFDDLKK